MALTIVKERGLSDTRESLDAPEGAAPLQDEAVQMWQRKIATSEDSRDQPNRAAKAPPAETEKFAQSHARLDASDENRLESAKDVLLRRLGGLRCKPAP